MMYFNFDMGNNMTEFEKALTEICTGWIGFELGWQSYIKDNAHVLLEIAIGEIAIGKHNYEK